MTVEFLFFFNGNDGLLDVGMIEVNAFTWWLWIYSCMIIHKIHLRLTLPLPRVCIDIIFSLFYFIF